MKHKIALALCALAVAVPTFAQQPGGGRPPMVGPGPGMMRGMGGGGPRILMQPDVQQELNLSQNQITQLSEILGRGQQGGGRPGGPPPNGQGGAPPPPRQGGGQFGGPPPLPGGGQPGGLPPGGPDQGRRVEELEAKIKTILNTNQFNRYQELSLQSRGATALLDKKVADKLGLSESQIEKMHEVMQQNRPQPPAQNGAPPDPAQMDAHRKSVEAKLLAVLTSDQKAAWQKMLGKPFAFKRMGPPQGGRRGGE